MAGWFPNCENLEVTDMEFDQTTGKDTLYVTVFNECDTCGRHGYNGLLITLHGDTLARTKYLNDSDNPTPDNNSSWTYPLLTTNGRFELSDSLRVFYAQGDICDSIPFASDIFLSINETVNTSQEKNLVEVKGDRLSVVPPNLTIQDLAVYNVNGKLLLKKKNLQVTKEKLNLTGKGLYIINVTLSDNQQVSLKYMEP